MSPTKQDVTVRSPRILDTPTALFMLAALIFLYAFLFVPPFIPVGSSMGDSMVYVSDGMRMYEGELIYRDFFQFSTPGTSLVYFLLFKTFGVRLWVPNLSLLLLGLGLAGIMVVIAKKLMRPGLALLPSAIFLAGIYKNDLNPIHHWYSVLMALTALAVLMERRTPARIATAGFFCGLAICFTQARGVVVAIGIAAYLWWESRARQPGWRDTLRKEAFLVIGLLAILVPMSAYFVWKAGLARFLWCTIVFGIKYYPQYGGANTFLGSLQDFPKYGTLRSFLIPFLQWAFAFVAVPLSYVLFFARYWRECGNDPGELWERPMLLAMVGSSLFLSIASIPSLARVALSTLPGIILLVWLLDCPRRLAQALTAVLVMGVMLVASHSAGRFQLNQNYILRTARGTIAIPGTLPREEIAWVQRHARPGDYFYSSVDPGLYFYADLRNPTPLPFLTNTGYTTPEQVAEVIRGLEMNHVRYIFWDSQELGTLSEREKNAARHLSPLRHYICTHYRLVGSFANLYEFWERKG